MKIKNLLLIGMCALSMGAFAQTTMFYETFGTNGHHEGTDASTSGEITANNNAAIAAYKVDGNFYFAEAFLVHGDWGVPQEYPDASLGSVLGFTGDDPARLQLTIKVNTSTKPYALLSYAHSINAWNANSSAIKVSYSFDNGSTWTEFNKANANVGSYGAYDLIEHTENIGNKSSVYIRLEHVNGSAMIDDVKVVGYDVVPVNKTALNDIIFQADHFLANEGMEAQYCFGDILAFSSSAAYTTATTAKNSATATQAEVDAATEGLTTALNALKATALDFTDLEASIAAAEEYAADPHVVAPLTEAERLVETGLLENYDCAAQSDLEAAKAELDQAVSDAISVDGATAGIFGLYPNPADDFIQITGVEGGIVYIFNAVGQQVLSVYDYNGDVIPVGSLAPGVYTAACEGQSISFIKK